MYQDSIKALLSLEYLVVLGEDEREDIGEKRGRHLYPATVQVQFV